MTWIELYDYRAKIPVNSTVSGAQTNYQMKLTIFSGSGTNTSGTIYLNGNSLSWPNDIRFTDANGYQIDFWRETSDATSGIWWLEIPSIPSTGSVNLYVHYGKASDTDASNGTNTFIQYHGQTTTAFYDPDIKAQPLIYEAKARVTSASHDIRWGFTSNSLANPADSVNIESYSPNNWRVLIGYDNSTVIGGSGIATTPVFATNTWYRLKIVLSTTHYDGYVDGVAIGAGANTTGLTSLMGMFMLKTSGTSEQEFSFIRKYVATEPTWATPLSQEANTNWNYRKEITITNSGSVLTDYQVPITVDTATLVTASKMRSDCGDIRFTDSDGSTFLSYWIESGANTSSTKMWIKIPSIPGSPTTKTIYIYYGNSSQTYDNTTGGNNTFLLFDDFNAGSLDTLKWTPWGTPTISAGNLNINSAEGIGSVSNISSTNIEATTRMRVNSAYYGGTNETHIGIDINQNSHSTIGFITNYSNIYGSYIRDTTETYGMWTSFSLGTYHIISTRYSSTTTYGTLDGVSYSYPKVASSGTNKKIYLKEENWMSGSSNADFDWIFVRKYVSPEPTFSTIGAEEVATCGTPSANLIVLEIISVQLERKYPSYIDLDAISRLIDNTK